MSYYDIEKSLVNCFIENIPIQVETIELGFGAYNVIQEIPFSKRGCVVQNVGFRPFEVKLTIQQLLNTQSDTLALQEIIKKEYFNITVHDLNLQNKRFYPKEAISGLTFTKSTTGLSTFTLEGVIDTENDIAEIQPITAPTINQNIDTLKQNNQNYFQKTYRVFNQSINRVNNVVNNLNAILINATARITSLPTRALVLSSNITSLQQNFFSLARSPLQLYTSLITILNNAGSIMPDTANEITFWRYTARTFAFTPLYTYSSFYKQLENSIRPVEKTYYSFILSNYTKSISKNEYKTKEEITEAKNDLINLQNKSVNLFEDDIEFKNSIDVLVNNTLQILNDKYNTLNNITTYKVDKINTTKAFYDYYGYFDANSEQYNNFLILNNCLIVNNINDTTFINNEVKFYK